MNGAARTLRVKCIIYFVLFVCFLCFLCRTLDQFISDFSIHNNRNVSGNQLFAGLQSRRLRALCNKQRFFALFGHKNAKNAWYDDVFGQIVAEAVGFEPTCRSPDKRFSRAPRYGHFGTPPFIILISLSVPAVIRQPARHTVYHRMDMKSVLYRLNRSKKSLESKGLAATPETISL